MIMLCDNCKCEIDKRTLQQNSAFHLFFELLAQELNDGGFDMKKVIRVDIPWTANTVKNNLWKPLQEALLEKKSTTQLTRAEVSKVYDVLNRVIAERCNGLHVPFPSNDYLLK